jgi:hypothetical protein
MGLRLAYESNFENQMEPPTMPANCLIQIVFVLAFAISFVSWLLKNKN